MTRLISAEVMEMTPKELKQLEKQVLSRIKIELDILKLSPLTKQQRQASDEYHIELETKIYNELSDEDCLKLIKKLTLNDNKQQNKYRRLVELDHLQKTIKLFRHDYSDKNDHYIQKLLVILSHYPIWNTCECK